MPKSEKRWEEYLRHLYHSALPPGALAALALWFWFSTDVAAPIGLHITVAGLAAAMLTIWPPENRFSKAVWILVFFGLTALEVNTLYKERDQRDKEQGNIRDSFRMIADSISESVKAQRDSFNVTVRSMEHLASLASENVKTITGGDSFAYLNFIGDGGTPIIVHQGRYPLYDVSVRIADLDSVQSRRVPETLQDAMADQAVLRPGSLSVGKAWIDANIKLTLSRADARNINVFFVARNGSWEQVFRSRLIGGRWLTAMRVRRHDVTRDKPRTAKQIFQRVDKGFPLDLLKSDGGWEPKPTKPPSQ